MSDERLSKQTVSTARRGRPPKSAVNDRVQADAIRLANFRASFAQAALPDIPPIPGYHVVWLASNNSRDTLQMRHRMGYTPVTEEDVKGFEFVADKGGLTDGLIRVNEMVAYKLPLDLYQLYMRENHHDRPAQEETKLTDAVNAVKEAMRRKGGDVDEGDGVEALRRLDSVRIPDFTDMA